MTTKTEVVSCIDFCRFRGSFYATIQIIILNRRYMNVIKNNQNKQENCTTKGQRQRRKPSSYRGLQTSSNHVKNHGKHGHQQTRNKSRNRQKGGQVDMFPTDINMRDSDTRKGELEERKRHNRKDEELTARGQDLGVANAGIKAAGGIVGSALRNHPEWYLKDPLIADQNTQISTQIPVGYNQKVFEFASDQSVSDKTCSFVSY